MYSYDISLSKIHNHITKVSYSYDMYDTTYFTFYTHTDILHTNIYQTSYVPQSSGR